MTDGAFLHLAEAEGRLLKKIWPLAEYHNGFCQYCQTLSKSRIPMYLDIMRGSKAHCDTESAAE